MGPNDRIDTTALQQVRSYAPDSSTTFVVDEYNGYKEHPVLFLATAWTATSITVDVTEDVFKEFVDVAISSGEFVARKLSNFMFVDAVLRVEFVVQGSSVAQGKLVYSFDPTPYPDKQSAGLNTHVFEHRPQRTRCMLIPHVEIDPSESKTYVVELPAPTRYGLYSLARNEAQNSWNLGSYHMRQTVVNALGSGTTTIPDISIAIYMSLVSPKVSSATAEATFTLTSLVQEKTDPLGGVISGFLNKATDVVDIIAAVTPPAISAPMTLFSTAAKGVGKFFQWFGFSKPIVLDPDYATVSTQANWTKLDGKIRSDQLSLRSNVSMGLSDKNCPLLDYNDMVVANLMKRPGLVRQFNVPLASASGAFIGSLPVHPCTSRPLDDPAINGAYEMTPLMFTAYPYARWRGTIDVDLEFVCSVFHRCTIVVLYDPSGFVPAAPPYLRYVSTLQHWTFHVNGHTKHRISLPWKQPAPHQIVSRAVNLVSSTVAHSDYNGVLWFFLLNPITTNGGTAPVGMNFYYSSSDMRYGFVENKFPLPVLIEPPEEGARPANPQSPFEEENPVFQLTSKVAEDDDFFLKFFGEEHAHSVKELASRQTTCIDVNGTVDDLIRQLYLELNVGPQFFPPQHALNIEAAVERECLLSFLAFSYVGNRGSIEWTVFPNGGRSEPFTSVGVYQAQRSGGLSQASGFNTASRTYTGRNWTGESMAYMKVNPSLQFNTPYYYRGLFRPTCSGVYYGDDGFILTMNADTRAATTPQLETTIMQGGGDDFVFVGFRGTPVMEC